MAITRRTDFAIRFMCELAQLPPGATLSVRDLCELADVPESFGTSLVPFLVDADLVQADGYRDHLLSLALPAERIPIATIIEACEPEFSLAACSKHPHVCSRSPHCGVHTMWVGLDSLVLRYLEHVTLADVAHNQPAPPAECVRMLSECLEAPSGRATVAGS